MFNIDDFKNWKFDVIISINVLQCFIGMCSQIIIDTKNNSVVRNSVYLEETPSGTTYLDSITIVNPGFGYTAAPIVKIVGDGMGATAKATVVNGQINNITITNANFL